MVWTQTRTSGKLKCNNHRTYRSWTRGKSCKMGPILMCMPILGSHVDVTAMVVMEAKLNHTNVHGVCIIYAYMMMKLKERCKEKLQPN